MKKIPAYLFLILFSYQAPLFAKDISNFQIEGMSVGDSLLDYMTEVEIKNAFNNAFYFKDNKFVIIYGTQSNINTYEKLQIILKPNDKDHIIYSLSGQIYSFKNINECLKIKDEIVGEISEMFKNIASKRINDKRNHDYDKTGNSKSYTVDFFFETGGHASVHCVDWSEELTKKKGWRDSLGVDIISQEFKNFLGNEPYK